MKKILLFLTVIFLASCSEVGYMATVEITQNGVIDTINVPYSANQVNIHSVFAPKFELENGVLSEELYSICSDVESFSVLSIEKLKNK